MANIADLLREVLSGNTPPIPQRRPPVIPDPNQLSIPSEPAVRGGFGDRIRDMFTRGGGAIDMDPEILNKGAAIALSSILQQFQSLPSDPRVGTGLDVFLFGGSGIEDPLTSPSNIPKEDLRTGELRQRLRNFQGREI